MVKTRKELEKDLDKYQAQIELLINRGPRLNAQDAYDLQAADINLLTTHVEIQRQRIDALEDRVAYLESLQVTDS